MTDTQEPTQNSTLVESALEAWKKELQAAAKSGLFLHAAHIALGLTNTPAELSRLNEQFEVGNFELLPELKILKGDILGNAQGAYSSKSKHIYISNNWFKQASISQIVKVLNEELGHHLDARLKSQDSIGDEGELFALLLTSNEQDHLSKELVVNIRAEQDHGKIQIGNKCEYVEFAVINGNNTAETLKGTSGADTIHGGDEGKGVEGDSIYGYGGADNLSGGAGIDYIFGGGGADIIYADDAGNPTNDKSRSFLFGGEGNDTINSGKKNDVLRGDGNQKGLEVPSNSGNDELYGNNGHDLITGGYGNDVLSGGQGDDYLDAGPGSDIITAGRTGDAKSARTDHYFQHDGHSKAWTSAPNLANSATLINGETITFANGTDVIYDFHHSDDQLYLGNTTFNIISGGEQLSGLSPGDNYFIQGTWSISDWVAARTNFRTNNYSGTFTTGQNAGDKDLLVLYNSESTSFFDNANSNYLILDFDDTFANSSSASEPTDMVSDPGESLRQLPILITGASGSTGDSSVSHSMHEGNQSVHTFSNGAANGTTYWSIVGGDDQSLFNIDDTTGELKFNSAPIFSNPNDNNNDNTYDLIIKASHSTGATEWDRAKDYRSIDVMQSYAITITSNQSSSSPQTFKSKTPKSKVIVQPDRTSLKVTEGAGLWLQLEVTDANTTNHNILSINDDQGEPLGVIGSTNDSSNLGKQEIYVPGGTVLNFSHTKNKNTFHASPALSLNAQSAFITAHLNDNPDIDSDYDDLIVKITSSNKPQNAKNALIASEQKSINDTILNFNQFDDKAFDIRWVLQSNCSDDIQIGLVKINNYKNNAQHSATFESEHSIKSILELDLFDKLINPEGETTIINGKKTKTFETTILQQDKGYYSPIFINRQRNHIFAWGLPSMSENAIHIRNLGQNFFCFEDTFDQGNSDWDFNDITLLVEMI